MYQFEFFWCSAPSSCVVAMHAQHASVYDASHDVEGEEYFLTMCRFLSIFASAISIRGAWYSVIW